MSEVIHDLAIVGGGVAGLTVAYKLAAKGNKVVIFEREKMGGKLLSRLENEELREYGPHTIAMDKAFELFAREIGIYDLFEPIPPGLARCVFSNNSLFAVPTSIKGLISCSEFSLREKLSLAYGLLFRAVDKNVVENGSIHDVFASILPLSFVVRCVAPGMRGIVGGDIKQLGFKEVFPHLAKALQEKRLFIRSMASRGKRTPCWVKGGGERICKRLVELCINHEVCFVKEDIVGIECNKNQFYINGNKKRTYRGVIVACHRWHDFSPEFSSLAELSPRHCPVLVCHVAVDKVLAEHSFGVLFEKNSKYNNLLGILFPDSLRGIKNEKGQNIVICFGGSEGESVQSWTAEKISSEVGEVLNGVYACEKFSLKSSHLWKEGLPQYGIKHQKYLEGVSELQNKFPGLHFIGTDIEGIGVPGRVECALKVVSSF